MTVTIVVLVVLGIVLFVLLNIAAREMFFRIHEMKRRNEWADALEESLKLDFTRESKTLKRTEVQEPKAKILCVDDEEVILDSIRKVLVLDGYSVDTVETGQEALGLVQMHDYDFVFTDLKMPAMPGTEVAKSVKHLRPDIDVVIITGYATVESAVECMKYGATDYIQKPFTEDELRTFVKRALIKRQDRIARELKPRVHVLDPEETERVVEGEFAIPGGVLVSSGHCWAGLSEDGNVKIGVDDFANKLLGTIDSIDFPYVGMTLKAGDHLFSMNQGARCARFHAPVSGKVVQVNEDLRKDCARLERTPYGRNWICVMEGNDLDAEIPKLKIGKSAVALIQEDIDRFKKFVRKSGDDEPAGTEMLHVGAIDALDDSGWKDAVGKFFDN